VEKVISEKKKNNGRCIIVARKRKKNNNREMQEREREAPLPFRNRSRNHRRYSSSISLSRREDTARLSRCLTATIGTREINGEQTYRKMGDHFGMGGRKKPRSDGGGISAAPIAKARVNSGGWKRSKGR